MQKQIVRVVVYYSDGSSSEANFPIWNGPQQPSYPATPHNPRIPTTPATPYNPWIPTTPVPQNYKLFASPHTGKELNSL